MIAQSSEWRPLLDLIQAERGWSWSIIALAALCIGLLLRYIALGTVLKKMKAMPVAIRKEVQSHYSKRSLVGWLFFYGSIGLVVLLWNFWNELGDYCPLIVLQAAVLLGLTFSIFSHARSYLYALLKVIENKFPTTK